MREPSFSFESLQGAYLRDLLDQPRAVADTVNMLAHVPELDRLRGEVAAGRYRRIVLTGMGGSYQVLYPLHMRLVEAGLPAVLVETSELIYGMPRLLDEDTLLVALSQSGASAETVRMLDLGGGRPFCIGVTNTEGSPLATRTNLTLMMQAGEEVGVSCKTSVASMVVLEWLGEHLCGGDLPAARADLETLAQAMQTYLDGWQGHVAALASMLDGVEHFFGIGRGRSMAAAGLGSMIQKEAAHVHGEGMGCAAFRHGPFEMLGPDVFVLVFEGDEAVRALNRGMARDVLAAGARAALCGPGGDGPFRLPAAPARVLPILELLPPQMISLAMAGLRGREPGKFERLTKVTTVE